MSPEEAAEIVRDLRDTVRRAQARKRVEVCALSHLAASSEGAGTIDALAATGLLAESREDFETLADIDTSLKMLDEALTD